MRLHGGDSYISLKSGKVTVGGGVYEINAQSNILPPKPMGGNVIGLPDVQANDEMFQVLSPAGAPLPSVDYGVGTQSRAHIFRTDDEGRPPALNTVEQETARLQLHWDELSAPFDNADA